MKKSTIALIAFLHSVLVFGQTKTELQIVANEIVAKAKVIYELEFVAWIANDTFLTKQTITKQVFDSYVTYKIDDKTICIFYNKSDTVLAEYVFQNFGLVKSIYNSRSCSPYELELIKIKRSVSDKIEKRKLKKFEVAANTTYNFVPVIIDSINICYLINAINDKTKVILGRDYKIILTKNYDIEEVTCNHKSIQYLPFNVEGINAFYHTHILNDYFSETELATTMLYKKYLPTDQFIIISNKYKSVWDSTKMSLTITNK